MMKNFIFNIRCLHILAEIMVADESLSKGVHLFVSVASRNDTHLIVAPGYGPQQVHVQATVDDAVDDPKSGFQPDDFFL